MSENWGPHCYVVPSPLRSTFSGNVVLCESLDEDLLRQELIALDFPSEVLRVNNPWYYGKKDTDTWLEIGESDDKENNFPVVWDTSSLESGKYEVMGMMHVFVEGDSSKRTIARQSVVEVTVKN